jgi:sortase A
MAEPDDTTGVSAADPAPGPRLGKFDRPSPPRDWRFWVGGFGKVLIATGLLMFGFVGYQLWGTGIETARAQNALESEFTALLDGTGAPLSTTTATSSTTSVASTATTATTEPVDTVEVTSPPSTAVPAADQNIPTVEEGDAIARLEIPAIGVDEIVVAGVEKSDLKRGPGHYPETPLPGQLGNSAIAGHRTTYGQPFYDVDRLQPGDEIITTTPAGRFVYKVTGQSIVTPDRREVVATIDPTVANLTLTSCHPRWTAQKRIVITSELDAGQSDPVGEAVVNYGREPEVTIDSAPAATADSAPEEDGSTIVTTPATGGSGSADAPLDDDFADAFGDSWFSDPSANGQVALWGALLATISIGAYLLSRKLKRDWAGALVGVVPFVIALYFFFQNVNRLLPPNL